jgi:hypothetical protein
VNIVEAFECSLEGWTVIRFDSYYKSVRSLAIDHTGGGLYIREVRGRKIDMTLDSMQLEDMRSLDWELWRDRRKNACDSFSKTETVSQIASDAEVKK